jgi:hypothetical protein
MFLLIEITLLIAALMLLIPSAVLFIECLAAFIPKYSK